MTFPIELTADDLEKCQQTNTSVEDAQFLRSLTGRPIELLKFDTDYGELTKTTGIYSYIDDRKGKAAVLESYDKFQNEGKLLFLGNWELLNEKRTIENGIPSVSGDWCELIGLLNTTADPFELIKLVGTSWGNCSITTEQLIQKAKEWNARFGLKIFHVTYDSFAAQIINKDLNYLALAAEIHEMCSDPDNTDTTIEENAEQIRKTGEIYLWWD
jgi:Domain of unknown function (DUF4253)